MVNYSFFSFINLISSNSTRLCAPSGSKPYGALRIRIEIVLPLPPKMGWRHCVTNKQGTAASKDSSSNRSNVIFWCSAKQATIHKWLSRFWLRCGGDHMCRKRVTDSWYSTINKLTVGDVHRTLCKQKQTSASCATNGERSTRNTPNRLWTSLLQQMRLEHFEIISSVSIST